MITTKLKLSSATVPSCQTKAGTLSPSVYFTIAVDSTREYFLPLLFPPPRSVLDVCIECIKHDVCEQEFGTIAQTRSKSRNCLKRGQNATVSCFSCKRHLRKFEI